MSKRSQRIQIGDLRPGMYVVKLDRPWASTPFDPRGFPISSPAQVRILAKYCKSVHVGADAAASRAVGRVKKKISLAAQKTPVRKPAGSRARKRNAARAR